VQWYALYTKPNAEYQLATTLQQRKLEVYLPEIEAPKARTDRKRKPFFPSYLFVHVDLETVGLSNLRWIPGLRRIVAFDDRPMPVPGEIIDLLRYKLGEIDAAGGRLAHSFQPGDSVRIVDGPFRDLLAIFDGPTTPAKRVQVLLRILGASRVQVDVTDLEKVSSDSEEPVLRRPRRTRGRGRRITY
jgi:transcription elongation factor/antiterminator RfaH